MGIEVLFLAVLHMLATFVSMVGGSVALAALSATRRGRPVNRHRLLWGALIAMIGAVLLWRTASLKSPEVSPQNVLLLSAVSAGGIGALFLGLGPFVPWTLKLPGRVHAWLPRPLRAPARELAGHTARTAGWAAAAMLAGAATFTVAFGAALQSGGGAFYEPQARPGALVVDVRHIEDRGAVRDAMRREVPSAEPITVKEAVDGSFFLDGQALDDVHIGDEDLLHYLTADDAFPYHVRSIVILGKDHRGNPFPRLEYEKDDGMSSPKSTGVDSLVVRPPDPSTEGVFIPSDLAAGLGADLVPKQLIIDPSVHRVSAEQQERLDRVMGEDAASYVERGYQPSAGRLAAEAVPALVALAAVLAAAGRREGSRVAAAGRAWLIATCSASLGIGAGAVMGLLLIRPMSAAGNSAETLPPVLLSFPWVSVAALAVGLPPAAALLAALSPRRR